MLLAETRRQRALHLAARVLVADGLVAAVGRHARYRERPGARPGPAGVALRAGVAVVAGGAVGLRRVGARAGRGVAGAGDVALIGRGADDGIRAGARPGLTGVGPGAGAAVVAGGAIGVRGVGARAGRGVAGAGGVALVGRGADDGVRAGARPGLTGVGPGAGGAVVAGGAIGLRRVGARAGRGVAGAGDVALVGRGADDRVGAGARPGLAGIGLRAGVAVVARGAVGPGRVGAETRRGIAHTGIVALVGRGAGDRRVRAAGRGAGVDRARVAVVAAGTREHHRRLRGLVEGAQVGRGRDHHAVGRTDHELVGAGCQPGEVEHAGQRIRPRNGNGARGERRRVGLHVDRIERVPGGAEVEGVEVVATHLVEDIDPLLRAADRDRGVCPGEGATRLAGEAGALADAEPVRSRSEERQHVGQRDLDGVRGGRAAAVQAAWLGQHPHDGDVVDGEIERVLRARAGGGEPGVGERAHPLAVEDLDHPRERPAARARQAHVGGEAGIAGDHASDRHLRAARVRDTVAVAVLLSRVRLRRAVVAGVAHAVAVGVGLVGVVGLRAVVDAVADTVAVTVGAPVTRVADAVTVAVGLVGVVDGRAVVAGVAHAIAVRVGLLRVERVRAVVAAGAEAVRDAVAVDIAASHGGDAEAEETPVAEVARGAGGARVAREAVEEANALGGATHRDGHPREAEGDVLAAARHVDTEAVAGRRIEERQRRGVGEGRHQRARIAHAVLGRGQGREQRVVQVEREAVARRAVAVGVLDREGHGRGRRGVR